MKREKERSAAITLEKRSEINELEWDRWLIRGDFLKITIKSKVTEMRKVIEFDGLRGVESQRVKNKS